jgi:hypothetical protein
MHVMQQDNGHEQPSSPLIDAWVPARGQAIRWLIGRLILNGLMTARAEAILPSIPALELFVTAQAGGGASIRGGFRGLLISTWGLPPPSCPQERTVAGKGLCLGPDTLSATTAED